MNNVVTQGLFHLKNVEQDRNHAFGAYALDPLKSGPFFV
jgi:hypothetical protein